MNIKRLEELNLSENFMTKINSSIAKPKNLTTLDLSNNNLETIEPQSLENLTHLSTVCVSGNSKLQMEALEVVLACKKLHSLHSRRHFSERKDELNRSEMKKFDVCSRNFVIPYSPGDAPHIQLGDHEKIYKMDSCPKGIALIINNHSYQHYYRN